MGEPTARLGEPSAAGAALGRFFDTFYRQRPVTATFTGLHDHDERLPDWSPDGLARAVDEMRALRRQLDSAGRPADDAVGAFPHDVDLALADATLEIALAELDSGHFIQANPSLWTGEAIFGVLSLVTRDFGPLDERLAHACARLDAIPAFLDQARLVLDAAPAEWTRRAVGECETAATLVGETLPAWATAMGASSALEAAGTRAAQAFARFGAWLESRTPGGVDRTLSNVPTDLFPLLLRRGHWHSASVTDVLDEATEALAAARAALDAQCAPLGGWAAVQEQLAADRPTADTYFSRLHERWTACRQAAADHDLVTWPEAPLRYVPYPAHTAASAPHLYYLHYRSPAPFDPFGTFDYVVPGLEGRSPDAVERHLRVWNHSTMTLNHVVHHGAIGHHVQNHHAYRGASRIGRVAAVDAANRIAMFSGGSLAEGWACYVCDLMEEVGFLTPLESLAQQHTRVRIAARAVADLSIHTGRLTVDEAARLYEDRAHMSAAAARAEAVRNSMFPGTAVMYWLGTRGIHRLRTQVSAREGVRFSRRRFHDRVLSYGAIPVALIAQLMLAEDAV